MVVQVQPHSELRTESTDLEGSPVQADKLDEATASSPAQPADAWTAPDASPAQPQETGEAEGLCASICDSLVAFTAHWFGALRFDHDPERETTLLMPGPVAPPAATSLPTSGGPVSRKANFKQQWQANKQHVSLKHAKKVQGGEQDQLRSLGDAEETDKIVYDATIFVAMHYPIFTVVWTVFVLLLWIICSMKDGTELAGFESIWPKQTDLALVDVNSCTDYRGEVWRWWTYQFSHVGASHVGMNCLLVLVFGIPLEGWHGPVRLFAMFQLGVVGGALCCMVIDSHTRVVGMSGGCYALVGMHFGDLLMNFKDKRFAAGKVAVLLLLAAIDLVQSYLMSAQQVSHSAHFGGFVAGILLCTFVGYNKDVLDWERVVRISAAMVSVALITCCLAWGMQWAPMTLFDPVRWCWLRQVISVSYFGDNGIRCVRCDSQACIDKWVAAADAIATIAPTTCWTTFGGFAVSER